VVLSQGTNANLAPNGGAGNHNDQRHETMKRIGVFALIISLALMAGCSFIEENPNTARLTTQYATAKIIDNDSDRAARIVAIASEARATIGEDSTATIAKLDDYVRSQIRWNSLAPEDSILIDAVLSNARDRLQEEISAGILDPDQRVALGTFLSWIEEVAARYEVQP